MSETASKAFSLAHMAHSADTEFSSPAAAPARKAGWVHAHCARLRSPYETQDKPFASGPTNPDQKGCDIMLKINYMSTLFVGIDVSSKSNAVYAMLTFRQHHLTRRIETKRNHPTPDGFFFSKLFYKFAILQRA